MAERKQSGLAHEYTEWVPENDVGVTPNDPDFQPFSDNIRTAWDGEPDASTEAQRGLGDRDPNGFFNGPEEHEFTFVYDLQQWYVDTNGDVQDPAGDIILDTSDNDVNATHTVVSREVHAEGGAADAGRHIVTVGKGGYASELTVPFETEDGLPVPQELVYRFEKVREYDVSQPSGTAFLGVRSTNADDTSQTVTIESSGGTSEEVDLNGATFVETSSEFDDIENVELSAETQGDIEIGTSDGASTPAMDTVLTTIYGANAYGGIEGDLGIPTVGSGSHASAIGSDYIRFREDLLHYEAGSDLAPEISSAELTIDAGIDATGKDQSIRQSIDVGQRETVLTASLAGPKPTVDQMQQYLQENANDIEWVPNTDNNHSLVLDGARLVTPGELGRETDAAKLIVESEWQAAGMTIS